MKKTVTVFLILIALSLCLLAGAGAALERRTDRVEVTEHTILGDISAARGLTVKLRCLNGNLVWDTALTLGEGRPVSQCTFHRDGVAMDVRELMMPPFAKMEIRPLQTHSIRGRVDNFQQIRDVFPYEVAVEAWKALCATQPGERRIQVLRLADIMDTYSWSLTARRQSYLLTGQADSAGCERLDQLFQVPVDSRVFVRILSERAADGSVIRLEVEPSPGPAGVTVEPAGSGIPAAPGIDASLPFERSVPCVLSRQGIYVFPSLRNEAGQELIYCRQGSGIYFIPFLGGEGETGGETPDAASTRLVYAASGEAVWLSCDAQSENLTLITAQDGALSAALVDGLTGRPLSVFPLMELTAPVLEVIERGELTLVVLEDGSFSLLERGEDSMKTSLTGRFAPEVMENGALFDRDRASLAFDGERMALAVQGEGLLLVQDAEGTKYLASFTFSPLTDGYPRGISGYPDLNDRQAMKVLFS